MHLILLFLSLMKSNLVLAQNAPSTDLGHAKIVIDFKGSKSKSSQWITRALEKKPHI